MSEDIKQLFELNKTQLAEIHLIISRLRVQDFDGAHRKAVRLMDHLKVFMDLLISGKEDLEGMDITLDENVLLDILKSLMTAQIQKDYILQGDIYEGQLLPVLYQLQESLLIKEELLLYSYDYLSNLNIVEGFDAELGALLRRLPGPETLQEQGYIVEPTSGGDLTLVIEKEGARKYLHSNINVWKEASALAYSWRSSEKTAYIIYGLGLGYHIRELLRQDQHMDIEVYESNIHIIQMACTYSDSISLFSNPNIKLIYDPDFTELGDRMKGLENDTGFVIHYPSLQVIPNSPVKEKLENYFIQYSAIQNQLPLLNRNFSRNIRNYDGTVNDLSEAFQDKTVYIVAAGPSLDKNYRKLLEVGENDIILATGTVYKKLMKAGIKPNYVLVTDPNPRVYRQISGLEGSDVPMLFLSTAYSGFASNYKGKRYIIFQKEYDKSEEFAKENGLYCIQTGGSVSTAALDLGITFRCRRIIFLGLDLAYTDNYAHASDTSRRNAAESSDLRRVEDIHGKWITTSRSLDMYRIWIENRIRDVKGIEFIDATEGGARIQGMRISGLNEVMREISK